MLSVKFTEKSVVELQAFIRNYELSFLRLYEDSGLWNEHLIREIYAKSAEDLDKSIRSAILEKLSPKKVLGRKEYESVIETDFYVRGRLIIVLFSDDNETNIRWVESIFIDRKPIAF